MLYKYWLELLLPLMETFAGLERKSTRPCLGCQGEGCSRGFTHPNTTHVSGRGSQGDWAVAQAELTEMPGTGLHPLWSGAGVTTAAYK